MGLYNSNIAKKIFPISSIHHKQEVLNTKPFLKPGWYFINYPFAYKIGSKIPQSAKELFKENFLRGDNLLWKSRSIFSLLFGWVRVRSIGEDQIYDFLYYSKRGYVKLFDNDRKKIKIDYKNEEVAINTYRLFESNLYLPLNKTVHKEGAVTEVDLIVGEPLILKSLEDRLAVYEQILNSFIEKLDEICKNSVYWEMDEAKAFFDLQLQNFTDITRKRVLARKPQILKCLTKCPLIMTHGDFCASNIIMASKGPVIMDFEHAKLRHAFYDVVSFPFNTVLLDEEYSLTVEDVKLRYWDKFNIIIGKLFSDKSIEVCDLVYIFLMHRSNDGSSYPKEVIEERLNTL
jgi:hypothetical protein